MKFVITLLIILFVMVGCSVANNPLPDQNQPKPTTITRCDMMGWSADSIIAEEKENGYRFTGSTRGFICYNDLHFELIETK